MLGWRKPEALGPYRAKVLSVVLAPEEAKQINVEVQDKRK